MRTDATKMYVLMEHGIRAIIDYKYTNKSIEYVSSAVSDGGQDLALLNNDKLLVVTDLQGKRWQLLI